MRTSTCCAWTALMMFLSVPSCATAEERALTVSPVQLEDTLAGIRVGSSVEALLAQHPSLYRNKLVMGEVLYEACNQDRLEVFSFTEEPWSKGFITYIWVRYEDVAVCRDQTGSLPDFAMNPATPRGVRLGDPESRVLEQYGLPQRRKPGVSKDRVVLEYQSFKNGTMRSVENFVLYFTVKEGRVIEIALAADMPGAKKPF